MQLSVEIEDNRLQEQITRYLMDKQQQTNELIVEALRYFFQDRTKNRLDYQTKDPEESATTIDFDLKAQPGYKLFQDVEDVQTYARELREHAWR
jgi:hypothetical protein